MLTHRYKLSLPISEKDQHQSSGKQSPFVKEKAVHLLHLNLSLSNAMLRGKGLRSSDVTLQ